MKKLLSLATLFILAVSILAGCSGGDSTTGSGAAGGSATAGSFDSTKEITVISREASSGTRGAFDELMGLIEKSGESEVNKLFSEAVIASSTDEVPAKVEVDKYAIGYTSIGAVNDSVKALKVDGVAATEENVKNGTYKAVSYTHLDVYKRQLVRSTPRGNRSYKAVAKILMSTTTTIKPAVMAVAIPPYRKERLFEKFF